MPATRRFPFLAAAFALLLAVGACKSAPPADDSTLSSAVQSRLAADAAIAKEPIQAAVQGGVATLEGTVSSPAARALAGSDASQIAGIHSVINNLTVQVDPGVQTASVPSPLPPHSKSSPLIAHSDRSSSRNPLSQPVPIVRQPPSSPAESTQPPVPPSPQHHDVPVARNVTVPSGTVIPIRITQTLDSATTQPGDTFSGSLSGDVIIDGATAFRSGSAVSGRVDAVHEAGHFKGSSLLTISLVSINRTTITTDPFSKEGSGRGKNTAEKVGGGAAVGAILGGIFGGGKGAAIGAAAGGGVGAGAQTITRGQQVQIPSETLLRFTLTNPVDVRAAAANDSSGDANLQRHPSN